MSIRADRVRAVDVATVLSQHLRIPSYQRPYSWDASTALQLLEDIRAAERNRDRQPAYVLGAVILHEHNGGLDVVDGQQRLLTLKLLLELLDRPDSEMIPPGSTTPLGRAWSHLSVRVRDWDDDDRQRVLGYVRHNCEVVQVVTDDVDEAFRVFDSQNYRGRPLRPHDLLKAHHLREMQGESDSMKAAVVEAWEAVGDAALDRLFSTYLYRIVRWSRGENAPAFTTHDIGMFKGISPHGRRFPVANYHHAAQTLMPVLNSWAADADASSTRDALRARFQLDAPVAAGKSFFEMIDFFLNELQTVRAEAFPDRWETFASSERQSLIERPGRSRYRKVSELYLAAFLYYTNRFGDEDLATARRHLFTWAYTPRVRLLRVQARSIDNRARGADGPAAFAVLRNSMDPSVVRHLPSATHSYAARHESDLASLMKELGSE